MQVEVMNRYIVHNTLGRQTGRAKVRARPNCCESPAGSPHHCDLYIAAPYLIELTCRSILRSLGACARQLPRGGMETPTRSSDSFAASFYRNVESGGRVLTAAEPGLRQRIVRQSVAEAVVQASRLCSGSILSGSEVCCAGLCPGTDVVVLQQRQVPATGRDLSRTSHTIQYSTILCRYSPLPWGTW